MEKIKYPSSVFIRAYACSKRNWDDLNRSVICGCYNCGTIFLCNDIREWTGLDYKTAINATAVCPYCGKSTVIGKSSEYPLDKEFLTKMKEYWEKEEGMKKPHFLMQEGNTKTPGA